MRQQVFKSIFSQDNGYLDLSSNEKHQFQKQWLATHALMLNHISFKARSLLQYLNGVSSSTEHARASFNAYVTHQFPFLNILIQRAPLLRNIVKQGENNCMTFKKMLEILARL